MNLLWHFLCDSIGRATGLRDRMRCPKCEAVGTWKPHGGLFDFEDTRKAPWSMWGLMLPVARWMCKCCGWYVDSRGVGYVRPDQEKGYWDFPGNGAAGVTPEELLGAARVWPWRG